MDEAWQWFKDPANRETLRLISEILGLIGGGIVVVVGGLWVAFKYFHGKLPGPNVSADRGGIAAGRDIHVDQSASRAKRKT